MLHDFVGFRRRCSEFEMATQITAADDRISATAHGLLCEFQFNDGYFARFCSEYSRIGG